MSGRKGMKQYPEWMKDQVRERIAAGETQKQLSKELGISRYSIQSWCGLRPETKLRQLAPMPKGKPKKNKTIEDYEKENKRLRMEVALMRDFLQSVERLTIKSQPQMGGKVQIMQTIQKKHSKADVHRTPN